MYGAETRSNCTSCGLPLAGSTCRACGGSGAAIQLSDGAPSAAAAFVPDVMSPELQLAYDAWSAGDLARVVSNCLAAEGLTDTTMLRGPDGPIFKTLARGQAMFVRVFEATGEIAIEIPVVRLPLTHYVPALRMLLEMSDRDSSVARFSVRGELALARFVGRAVSTDPAALCSALQAVAASAVECSRVLAGGYQAKPISPEEHADIPIDALPRGAVLALEAGSSPPPPGKGMFESMQPMVGGRAPTPIEDVPPILAGNSVPPAPPPRAKVPTPARVGRPTPGFIATGAKPNLVPPGGGGLRPPPTAALPVTPHLVAPPTAAVPPTAQTPLAPPPPARPAEMHRAPSLPPNAPIGRTMVSADGAATTEPSAGHAGGATFIASSPPHAPAATPDPLGDTFISSDGQPHGGPVKTGSPADGLCELLHKAQTLGAVLSFADQPATMCLLIRATVYRSIQEHEAVVPQAVAALYSATVPMTKEIYITAPGKRRGSMAIPPTSPAFEMMARIVAQRGEVSVAEEAHVQPITTAQEAKQHLARYVSEIDQAPGDLDLRHFLALGALCELLVRTKLPAATQDRLRGIVGHAKKEGAKQQVVDLMMTALTRMIA